MSLDEWKTIAQLVQAGVTALSLLVAGTWVYLRYVRQVEHRPNPRVALEQRLLGRHRGYWLIEVTCQIENMGKVPYVVGAIDLSTYVLRDTDAIASGLHFKGQVEFGPRFSSGSLFRPNFESIIDPGVLTNYRHICAVPEDASFARFFVTVRAPNETISVYTVQSACALPLPSESLLVPS